MLRALLSSAHSGDFPLIALSQPEHRTIEHFIETQKAAPFTYPEVGATQSLTDPTPQHPLGRRYRFNHHRHLLGRGRHTFLRAREAFRRWEMFHLSWVRLCWPTTPMEPGATVAILGHAMGLWSMNCCRIIYTVDDPLEGDLPEVRYGFAYGTTPGHLIIGEERMVITWNRADDTVWYEILSFARESQFLLRAGTHYLKSLQRQFVKDSGQALHVALRRG